MRGAGRNLYLDNLDDNAGPLTVWIFDSVYGLIPKEDRDLLVENAVVRLYGLYTGRQIQLAGVPEAPPLIEIVEEAP